MLFRQMLSKIVVHHRGHGDDGGADSIDLEKIRRNRRPHLMREQSGIHVTCQFKYWTLSIPVMLFTPVEGTYLFHLLFRQFKIKQLCIFPDMVRITGTRYHHHAFLQVPAQDHLRR